MTKDRPGIYFPGLSVIIDMEPHFALVYRKTVYNFVLSYLRQKEQKKSLYREQHRRKRK